jgi:O-antigen ligase
MNKSGLPFLKEGRRDFESPDSTDGLSDQLWRVPGYPNRHVMIFMSFLAFVVVRYIQLGARRDILATIRFEFLVGLIVIGLVSHQLSIRKPEIGSSRNLIFLIGLLFIAMVLQLPLAVSPDTAQKIFMDRVIKFAFLTYFMVVLIESPKYLRWFLAAFLFSIEYVTQEAVEGLISGSLVWENQGVMRLHGAVPIYEHPNSLGGVAMGSLPFVVFLLPQVKNKFLKLCLLITAGTSLVCVIYSGSRTAYVGLVAFVLWWFFQTDRKWRFLLIGAIAGVAFLSIIPGEYIERFESIGGQEKEGHSKETRMVIIQDALVILQENPLGVGIASFPAARHLKFGRRQDTHNLYLEVATNLGIQGFLVFMALVVAMMAAFRRAMMALKAQRFRIGYVLRDTNLPSNIRKVAWVHDKDLQFLIATAKASGGFILIRLVLGIFGMDLYEVYWWFGAGLGIVLSGLVVRANRITTSLVRVARDHS